MRWRERKTLDEAIKYSFTVRQTYFSGATRQWTASAPTMPDWVREDAFAVARQRGWTQPHWWQWWRRHDTRLPRRVTG